MMERTKVVTLILLIIKLTSCGSPSWTRDWEPDCPPADEDPFPTYFPYGGNCSLFWECTNGVPKLLECPSPLHWHQAELTCDHPSNANCVPSTTTNRISSTSTSTHLPTSPYITTTDGTTTGITDGPTTNIPTTTAEITTLPYEPSTLPAGNDTGEYILCSVLVAGKCLEVYMGNLTKGNKIIAASSSSTCLRPASRWELVYFSSTGNYVIRSALGDGNDQWNYVVDASLGSYPSIAIYDNSFNQKWRIGRIGNQVTMATTDYARGLKPSRTNEYGIDVDLVKQNSGDNGQWWILIQC